ncbi:unnamed protein product [Nippostrongylus brasiliensis]|uniref:Uncharacterized protein n=1 Tax=Nippostrongylus brasiliensis TaxID=27835 RepID=A0A0N4Y923_NIPBR|nr:unnamed protein product [Nippostrongylus brasiliensis]
MEEGQSSPNVKNELAGNEESSFSTQQLLSFDCEREIQILERDIRQQKESSVNAKTAITFEQLRKIHNLGKFLGPQKEVFFDRICRAADIQRASLKNRLKQNKESYLSPPTLHSLVQVSVNEGSRTPSSSTAELAPLFRPGSVCDDEMKLPAERSLDLMQLGFSFDEVKQIADLFDQYKEIVKPHNPGLTLKQVLAQFANLISLSVPENLKLLSYSFNLLEMGYSRHEVARLIARERRRPMLEPVDVDVKPKRSRPTSISEPNGDPFAVHVTPNSSLEALPIVVQMRRYHLADFLQSFLIQSKCARKDLCVMNNDMA